MRRNMTLAWDTQGKYATDLFTEEAERLIEVHDSNTPMFLYLSHIATHRGDEENPIQALEEDIAKFSNIEDPDRKSYAGI